MLYNVNFQTNLLTHKNLVIPGGGRGRGRERGREGGGGREGAIALLMRVKYQGKAGRERGGREQSHY